MAYGSGTPRIEVGFADGKVRLAGYSNVDLNVSRVLEAEGSGTARAMIPADELAKILRVFRHEPIALNLAGGVLAVRGSAEVVLPASGELGWEPWKADEVVGGMATADFLTAIERVIPAASLDTARPQLCSIQFEPGVDGAATFAATDSYRLAAVTAPYLGAGDRSYLIPRAGAAFLLRRFRRWGGNVRFLSGMAAFRVELADPWTQATATVDLRWHESGEFPAWRNLMPDGAGAGELVIGDLRSFGELVAAAGGVATSGVITLALDPGGARIKTQTEGSGTILQPIPGTRYRGEAREIHLNAEYLGALATVAAGRTLVRMVLQEDPMRAPVAGHLDRDGFAFLIMPVRVGQK
jgi:DNA polymerase III sliding clamp (beta) subunit (PCNA family)